MKALLWKELRALALWAVLMLVVAVTTMVGVLVEEFDGYYDANLFGNTVLQMTVFGSGCVALILGFLQTVLEVRRDQWAFLLHRGRSATQIFLAKASAGLLMYALIMLIPTLIAGAWCAVPGVERYPFSWYQLLPMLVVILASVSFYFAAILLIVWKGPWHFSRLLPLVAPVLLVMGVTIYATEITEYVPCSIFLITALADAILGVAAWGVFVRSGEAPHRPVTATCGLGVTVFTAMFLGFIGLFALAGAAYELYFKLVDHPGWRDRSHVGFFVNREGHLCRLVHGPARDRWGRERPVLNATDLDEPQSKRYANLVGKNLFGLREVDKEKFSEWDPLPMVGTRESFGFRSVAGSHVLEDLAPMEAHRQIHAVYSSADGWIYFYQETYKTSGDYQVRAAPQLLWVVGPDGFTDPSQRPGRRFGKLLVGAGSRWYDSGRIAWPDLLQKPSGYRPRYYLLFDDGLFAVGLADRSVHSVLTVPRGRRLRSLLEMDDAVAVVYDDEVAVHSAQTVPFGRGRDNQKGEEVDVTLNLPGKLRYSFPLPAEVKPFDRIRFGRVPDQDVIVFQMGNGVRTFDLNRFVHMRLDGTVLNCRDIRDAERLPPEALPVFCVAALLLPAGQLLLASGAEGIDQVVGGTGPGILVRLVQQSPIGMALVLGILIGSAACCAWSASRTARRYGFGKRERVAWLWVALLLGPAGLLTLWFVRDWPVRERCAACGKWRPVTLENCPDCGQTIAPPAVTGTEILEQRDVSQSEIPLAG